MSFRTLLYASIGSATAAIVTSYFWEAGTPIAAAATPVIVTLVSEMLRRPTERIAQRMTTQTDVLPEAAGAGPPPRAEELRPRPAREMPPAGPPERTAGSEPEFRVYRSGQGSRAERRPSRLPWKPLLATAAIAFVVAMSIITLPELIAGHSLGGGDRDTTLFGGKRHEEPTDTQETQPQQTQTERQAPEQTTTTPRTTPESTTTTTVPQTTTTAPAKPGQTPAP